MCEDEAYHLDVFHVSWMEPIIVTPNLILPLFTLVLHLIIGIVPFQHVSIKTTNVQ